MKITNKNNISKNTIFKRGLTTENIAFVKKMKKDDYKQIVNKLYVDYKIKANVGESNTVAYCLNQAVNTMSKAGFKLPKNFEFSPMPYDTLGCYNTQSDCVTINSAFEDFNNLEKLNILEESQRGYHPITGHFLQTYLHEFSHAAHYKNICSQHGETDGNQIFWGILNTHSPNDIFIEPIKVILQDIAISFIPYTLQCIPYVTRKIEDYVGSICKKLFPPSNGLYAKTSLNEYFAEKNARLIAEKLLGYDSIINFEKEYHKISYLTLKEELKEKINWNIIDEPVSKVLEVINDYIFKNDSSIYNGDIKKIMF